MHQRFTYSTSAVYSQYHNVKQRREFYRKSWSFANAETLPAGNYEYPFEAMLSGTLPESVEGLPLPCWVVYRMKATIDRGILASNIYATKHVRVIRTFDPSALELVHNMVSPLSLLRCRSDN